MPLTVGNAWTLENGSTRTITAIDKMISTPFSDFTALEVATESEFAVMYDYYVNGIGHVMSIYENKETNDRITSSLESMDAGY